MNFYHYLFYKLYKFTEEWGFWPVTRAFCLIVILNVALLGILLNFFTLLTEIRIHFPENKIWIYIAAIIIVSINYFLLLKGDKKDEIVQYFDKIPPKKNDIGSIVVFIVVVLLIVVYISSLFMLDN